MSVVWSLLALIIGVVVAYLLYDEYVVRKSDAQESDLEKDIQDDLVALATEGGVAEVSGVAPPRTASGEFVHAEQTATEPAVVEPAAVEASVDEEPATEEPVVETRSTPPVDVAAIETAVVDASGVESTEAEPAVVEPPIAETPVAAAADAAPQADDLTQIKGIGKVYAERLHEAGIHTYQQVIDADVAYLESVTKAIQTANASDWGRQAQELLDQ